MKCRPSSVNISFSKSARSSSKASLCCGVHTTNISTLLNWCTRYSPLLAAPETSNTFCRTAVHGIPDTNWAVSQGELQLKWWMVPSVYHAVFSSTGNSNYKYSGQGWSTIRGQAYGAEGLTGVNLDELNPKISPDACKTYRAVHTGKFWSSCRHAVHLKQKNRNHPVTWAIIITSQHLSGHHASSDIMSMSAWHASDRTFEVWRLVRSSCVFTHYANVCMACYWQKVWSLKTCHTSDVLSVACHPDIYIMREDAWWPDKCWLLVIMAQVTGWFLFFFFRWTACLRLEQNLPVHIALSVLQELGLILGLILSRSTPVRPSTPYAWLLIVRDCKLSVCDEPHPQHLLQLWSTVQHLIYEVDKHCYWSGKHGVADMNVCSPEQPGIAWLLIELKV